MRMRTPAFVGLAGLRALSLAPEPGCQAQETVEPREP